VVDAAKAGDIVILAIPTKAVADLPRGLFANVPSSFIEACSTASGSHSRSGVP